MKEGIHNVNLNKLRGKARRLQRECEAIYTLINAMTVDLKKQIDLAKERIAQLKKSELQSYINKTKQEINKLRSHLGVKVPNSVLVELLTMAEGTTKGTLIWLPKYGIKNLFAYYERAFPGFETFPEHICIGVDAGTLRRQQGPVELSLLEAILFEDMYALFNLSKEHHTKLDRLNDSKRLFKTSYALCLATITSAFYFVEAYLNGIAFDYYIANEAKLDDQTKMILTEWNPTMNRPRYLTLRDKALQYPRIILGSINPPLQESNCPELAFIIGRATFLRNAVVHASPKLNLETFVIEKQQVLSNIDFGEVERIVDNAATLVRKLETAVRGDDKRLFWLHERGPDGFFPEAVFN